MPDNICGQLLSELLLLFGAHGPLESALDLQMTGHGSGRILIEQTMEA